MPKDHSQPISEADRQARAAFKAYASARPGEFDAFALDMNPRTFDRIVKGARDVPPGAARDTALRIRKDMRVSRNRDQLESWAMALELWAEDCDRRTRRAALIREWVQRKESPDA